MLIDQLEHDISQQEHRPKSIQVSSDFWKKLVSRGKISWKRGYLEGVIDSGFDLPVFDENIFIFIEPELLIDGLSYRLL